MAAKLQGKLQGFSESISWMTFLVVIFLQMQPSATQTLGEDTDPCSPNPCLNEGECVQNGYSTYVCFCASGFIGETCNDTVSMRTLCYPNPCLNDGICSVTKGNSYQCNCSGTKGYIGSMCQRFNRTDRFILVADSHQAMLAVAPLETFHFQTIPLEGLDSVDAVAYDSVSHMVYWTDLGTDGDGFAKPRISRCNLDGTGQKTVLQLGHGSVPNGLDIDVERGQMYWTDQTLKTIERANLNGSARSVIVRLTRFDAYRTQYISIVVYSTRGQIFWTEWGLDPRIERANQDGTDRRILINKDLSHPSGFAIDFIGDRMYWGDAGPNRIESAQLDGSNRAILVVTGQNNRPFDIGIYGETIIWNWGDFGQVATINISDTNSVFTISTVFFQRIAGWHIQYDVCNHNQCVNGDCLRLLETFSCQCFPGWTGTLCDQDTKDIPTTLLPSPAMTTMLALSETGLLAALIITVVVLVLFVVIVIIFCVFRSLKSRRNKRESRHVLPANVEQNGLEADNIELREHQIDDGSYLTPVSLEAKNSERREHQIDDGSYLTPDQLANEYEAPIGIGDNLDMEAAPIQRNQLDIVRELGRGRYGRVILANVRGLIKSMVIQVAVKTTKESAPQMEKDGLLRELSLMRKLKRHTNVVGILGWCVETEPYYLILEYMANGNLKDFLMKSRKEYDYADSSVRDVQSNITPQQLMIFAKNVAGGMDFITSNKIALPIRWMALECLIDKKHTSESDVWSFGILLWEIITLGARPYPGMRSNAVISELKQGYRMPKPKHCMEQVFNLMLECWEAAPSSRPSFEQIIDKIDCVLDIQADYLVLDEIDNDIYDDTAVDEDDEKV